MLNRGGERDLLEVGEAVFCFVLFLLFRATPTGCRGSQARMPELQMPAYTTATAMQDLSCFCDLHLSSQQHQILNPLSKARDGTCILWDASQIRSTEPRQELQERSLFSPQDVYYNHNIGLGFVKVVLNSPRKQVAFMISLQNGSQNLKLS